MRHTLTSLVLAAVAAVLAGARSFTAIGEWAADAPPRVLAAPGSATTRWHAGSSRRTRPPSAGSWGRSILPRWRLRWGPGWPPGCRPAALRNLAVGILKLDGYPSIAAACRYHARDATRTLATLRLIPP